MTEEMHVIAYRNTFLANDEGQYVLGHLLTRLKFFDKCETLADTALRDAGIELLEDLGILFVEKAEGKYAEQSIGNFVSVIAKLDVTPLVDAQREEIKKRTEEEL